MLTSKRSSIIYTLASASAFCDIRISSPFYSGGTIALRSGIAF
jgi:hypothetical protein